jgi:hypothetical protein
VPLGGTQELFTKGGAGIKLKWSSTLGGGLLNEAPSDLKSLGRFLFWQMSLLKPKLSAKINIPGHASVIELSLGRISRTLTSLIRDS